ncbi:MAG TPA: hypothetical protein VHP80_20015 [Candidatus Acidoferrum sp.]|nr:hypothetical protein [Candidatus Acidoferrum sp.]
MQLAANGSEIRSVSQVPWKPMFETQVATCCATHAFAALRRELSRSWGVKSALKG